MEEDDGPLGRRLDGGVAMAAVGAESRAERPTGEHGQWRPTVDPDDELDEPAEQSVVERPVGDGRRQHPEAADQIGLAEQPVAEPGPMARLHRCPRPIVHLGDLHVGWADRRAPAAAGAVVDGCVGRRQVRRRCAPRRQRRGEAEALGLRPDVLRAGEEVRDAGDWTRGCADIALQAFVGRQTDLAEGGVVDDVLDRHGRVPARCRPTAPFAAATAPAGSTDTDAFGASVLDPR